METFDLSRLTDFDFEAVCKDLFEEELGVSLEIFSAGPDGGVDLRHFGSRENEVVIQCKHWHRSPRAKLIDYVRKSEAQKVQRLQPRRYMLATSVDLTRDAKDKLFQALKPYARTPGDIYGRHELDALLRKHEHVVRRHLRLWLTSATVLSALLSKRLVTRSQALAREIDDTLRKYSVNPSCSRALAILEQRKVCIIAGIPGIGKTTLSHVLCAHYLARDYELIEISEDVDEANELWDDAKRQVFYYDDFLGRTSLDEKLGKNEDGRLLSLMQRTANSPNKRFILTTREYILVRARQRYERLDQHPFSMQTCIIDLGDYSWKSRAEILYNHVYASQLPDSVKADFANPVTYRRILRHRNFTPRIIASTLAEAHYLSDEPGAAASEILANLEDPSRLWGHIVNNQLNDLDMLALKVVFLYLGSTPLNTFEGLWRDYGHRVRDLRKSLAVLDGTMLRSFEKMETLFDREGNIHIEFHNPSVRDYLMNYFSSNVDELESLFELVRYFEQLETLWIGLPVRGGGPLLSQYRELLSQLEEAATVATQAAPMPRNESVTRVSGPARRAFFLLEMAELLDSDIMRNLAFGEIEKHLTGTVSPHRDDLSILLQFLSDDETPEAQRALAKVVEFELERLFDGLHNWIDIDHAGELIEMLEAAYPGLEIQDARGRLSLTRREYAEDALEDWGENGPESIYSESEIRDIVAFYSSSNTPPGGYEKALARLDEYDWEQPPDPAPSLFDDYPEHARRAEWKVADEVATMMQTLGDRADVREQHPTGDI
ncbi:restriction endonuclease [Streptomyces sp. HMX87]|uniref:nSTAND3 domain-containing NTPase n=1 Tax=Streptomyces sp. HMX87 TaxID=3390849 RepID=UPI003A846E75